jgi:RHS repeat-associated protein
LKEVSLNNEKIISYTLDWDGRRISRSLNGSYLVRKIYESELQLAAEVDSITGNLKEYVYGTHINSPDYLKVGSDTYRIIKNYLGSPRLVVKITDGTIAQRMDYNEWGEVLQDSNPGFQAFGFAGGLYDLNTKLVKFGVRDYDGSIGRWLSKDPIRFEGGDTNLYGYVMNDPINFKDPTGLRSVGEFINDVKKAADRMGEIDDRQEAIRRGLHCIINGNCDDDPLEKTIPEEDEINPKNSCIIGR